MAESEKADIWNQPERAGKILKELEALRNERMTFELLGLELDDAEAFAEMPDIEETDAIRIRTDVEQLDKTVAEWELKTYLAGAYDRGDALVTIRSGAGGVDAQDWAEMLLRMYLRYAERQEWKTRMLDETRGAEAGIKSATIEVSGLYAYGYLHNEVGIHRLVRMSPFNADNLRQTSFASIEVLPVIENDAAIELRTEDLKIDTYRASGAGGQHVNKTESAVRITHIPTGLIASCQNERSQVQNREEALKVLKGKIAAKRLEEQEAEKLKLKGEVRSAEWGNQIRSYVLHPYTMVKDHRTNEETSDAAGVLDGDIDRFIEKKLRLKNVVQ